MAEQSSTSTLNVESDDNSVVRRVTETFHFGPNIVGVTWSQRLTTGVNRTDQIQIGPFRGTELSLFTRCYRDREDPYYRVETQRVKAFGLSHRTVDKHAGGDFTHIPFNLFRPT